MIPTPKFRLPITPSNTPNPSRKTHETTPTNHLQFYFYPSMGTRSVSCFLFPLSFFMFLVLLSAHNLNTYIVQLHPEMLGNSSFNTRLQWHLSFLERVVLDENPSSRLLYSYHSAIDGFTARLSDPEFSELQSTHGVIAVYPDHHLQIQTTYSYKFLGLNLAGNDQGPLSQSKLGQGTIIGILDTGIWPESPSFADNGMPLVPKKWRGTCQEGQSFSSSLCNRKLIGARFYIKGHRASSSPPPPPPSIMEYISPRDALGHGTHTSSTAAGTSVPSASVLGNGAGVAQGMAPRAHVAVYKVCWFNGCYSSDILAAMDDAIRDGVDILSLSLGGFPLPLYVDIIAIGAYRASERGIMVVCAAGNSGPIPSSVANEAPWITTVGASSLDRRFPANVHTGDGQILLGESMSPKGQFANGARELELVYGGENGAETCFRGSLSRERVSGKMVICDRGPGRALKGEVVKENDGAAMILANTEINLEEDSVDVHVLPATLIGYAESIRLKSYINSTSRPTARIEFEGTVIGKSRAPAVALFSSRGPSSTNPSILKPDIIAPGVNIIAAWPENLGPTGMVEDTRRVNFTVLSGTSMACPHVSGISALVRAAHPSWSPAAIKSAIMTTSDIVDHSGKPIMDGPKPASIFAMGAGHVNPTRAMDPGLVYDINPGEYIAHLCTLGYTGAQIFIITHKNVNCFNFLLKNRDFSLNYPSLSVIFKHGIKTRMIRRRLTNVGLPNSTYSVQLNAPQGVKVRVMPESLTFSSLYQSKIYRVWFYSWKRATTEVNYGQGHLTWVHNQQSQYKVRSPISVTWA